METRVFDLIARAGGNKHCAGGEKTMSSEMVLLVDLSRRTLRMKERKKYQIVKLPNWDLSAASRAI